MEEKLKIYRLKKIAMFSALNPKELYLAKETNAGYTMKIGEGEWVGLPKRLVERSPKVFERYDQPKHRVIKKNKRPRIINH